MPLGPWFKQLARRGISPLADIVPPEIEGYAAAHSVAESDVCRLIREETYRTQDYPQMVVGPLEAAFLKVMALTGRARRVLEIGAFTGYSALAMAEALPEDGSVLTCEIDPESAAFARRFWDKSPHGKKIEVRVGPALETLRTLTGPFDVIFIDADKANYVNYYRRAKELIAPTGVILIDNVLWSGRVLKANTTDPSTQAIQELNRMVASDPRVTAVLLTLRDGVYVIKPKI
jgi:predicted O-methyltransferase YrrM